MATKPKNHLWGILGYNRNHLDPKPRLVFAAFSRQTVHEKCMALKLRARRGMEYRTQMIRVEGEQ